MPLFATFLLRVSCPHIQFCPENQGFPLALYRAIKLLFCSAFCAFSAFFFSVHFCAFLHFSPHACIVLKNSFFARIFSNFSPAHYRVTKLFFCAHFCAFLYIYPSAAFCLFSHLSRKNRHKSMNNGDKSGKNRYIKLYSPVNFQAAQHLHFLACVLVRVTVRVKCL